MKNKMTIGQVLIILFISLYSIICLFPMLLVLSTSFATERAITLNGYSLIPAEFSTEAYRMMLVKSSTVPRSYGVTLLVTGLGTLIAVFITYGAGYTLANKQCRYRNGMALYFFITMVFSSGMIPWYLVSRQIGAYDNLWALIIPSLLFSPFNMFLTRNFIASIPDSLCESARVDGAGEIRIAFQIYLPLCTPVLATITLFYAIGYWNNYFNSVMLLMNRTDLYPLQMLLFKIQSEIQMISRIQQGISVNPPKESFKMATVIVTTGPIILLYPFLQKYFIKGMIIGAVKG